MVPAEPVDTEAPEPVEDVVESVVRAVPEAPEPEAEELPVDTGALDVPTG